MANQGKRKVKAINILEAIPGSGGIINTIAETLGVDWHTAKRAIDENPEALTAYNDELERRLDLAEGVVVMNIQMAAKQQRKGYFADTSDAKWYLSKKGKNREYHDKSAVDLSNSDGSLKPEEMKPSEIAARVAALLKGKDVSDG